jgi:hypothetical protein
MPRHRHHHHHTAAAEAEKTQRNSQAEGGGFVDVSVLFQMLNGKGLLATEF